MDDNKKNLSPVIKEQTDKKYFLSDFFWIFLIFLFFDSIFYLLFPEGIPLLFNVVLKFCYLLVVLFWTLKYRKWTKADLGLVDLANEKNYLIGVGVGFFLAFAVIGMDANTVYLLLHEAKLTISNFIMLIFLLPLVTLSSGMEELIYRGFFFTLLKKRLNLFLGIVLSSAIFAIAHQLGGETESIYSIKAVAFIEKFLLGVAFAFFYDETKSLSCPIIAHIVLNWCVIIVYNLVYYAE